LICIFDDKPEWKVFVLFRKNQQKFLQRPLCFNFQNATIKSLVTVALQKIESRKMPYCVQLMELASKSKALLCEQIFNGIVRLCIDIQENSKSPKLSCE